MLVTVLLILLGLLLVFFGAEALVRGSASLAMRLGVSPLLIGLTIVAYGTSFPELIVSVRATLIGIGDISIGNIIGSNIFNIALILGLAALIRPLKVKIQLIKTDAPLMIVTALLLVAFFFDRFLSRIEGLIFISGIVIYTLVIILIARSERNQTRPATHLEEGLPHTLKNIWLDLFFIAAGFVLLFFGANVLIDNSVRLARILHVSEAIIGLTIIAAGTSIPELATSVIAARRNQADIALANVIGSNIFNILGILGISALINPIQGVNIQNLDLWWMVTTTIALMFMLWSGYILRRWEGLVLLVSYFVYLILLWP